MRKNITRLLLAAMTAVLSFSLVFGLGGCAPTGPKAYTAAESTWYEYTGNKKAVDDITITAAVNLGTMIGDLDLAVNLTLEREYKGSEIKKITATVNSVSVTGISNKVETLLGTIIGQLGVELPDDFDLGDYIDGGEVVIDEQLAEGYIELSGGTYSVYGEVTIDMFGLDLNTEDDLENAIEVEADVVDDYMDLLGIEFKFDSVGFYQVPADSIGKDNKVTFDARTGLNYILQQAYDLLDTLLDGDLVLDEEEGAIVVPAEVADIMDDILGGTDAAAVDAFLFGSDGLIDLGTASLAFTYDADKRLSGIVGSQNITFAIDREQIDEILETDAVSGLLNDLLGMSSQTVSNLIFTIAKLPTNLEASISISFTSTFTYA